MILSYGINVYHGSYIIVPTPNLSKCESGKDFGKGFYVTTDIEQAKRFVKSSVGKAKKNKIEIANDNQGFVSKYTYKSDESLKIYVFENADREWLHCVAGHRKSGLLDDVIKKWKNYDIIAGKIANDNTNQVITAYINGLYGKVGSEEADRIAISLLLPERLTDQICFRTDKALKALSYFENEKVTI